MNLTWHQVLVGWLLTSILFMVMAMPLFYAAGLIWDRQKVYQVYRLYKISVTIFAIGVMSWIALT